MRAVAWLATAAYSCTGDWRGWRPLLSRASAHVAVMAVTAIAVAVSGLKWSASSVADYGSGSAMRAAVSTGGRHSSFPVIARISNGTSGTVGRIAQPHTIVPLRPRTGVITYTVRPGDTVEAIATMFHLSPTTIMWANPAIEDAPDLLRIGQQVVILPVDGVYHRVAADDTVEAIAAKYQVDPDVIIACEYNHLEPPGYRLTEGEWLIVPGGEKPYVPKVVTSYSGPIPEGARGTGRFDWPVLGSITQGYWYGHRAIDIGAPAGSAVLASDGGFVSFAGWTDVGYGYLIVIDHANGFSTYYAHLSNIYVRAGDGVSRNQVIGAVGSTGWSTGPHLHFEVRYYGEQQNPRAYLP